MTTIDQLRVFHTCVVQAKSQDQVSSSHQTRTNLDNALLFFIERLEDVKNDPLLRQTQALGLPMAAPIIAQLRRDVHASARQKMTFAAFSKTMSALWRLLEHLIDADTKSAPSHR